MSQAVRLLPRADSGVTSQKLRPLCSVVFVKWVRNPLRDPRTASPSTSHRLTKNELGRK